MNIDAYIQMVTETRLTTSADTCYPVLGLMEEAGELAGHFKRIIRDDRGEVTPTRADGIVSEAGDVLWYLFAIGLDYNLGDWWGDVGTFAEIGADDEVNPVETLRALAGSVADVLAFTVYPPMRMGLTQRNRIALTLKSALKRLERIVRWSGGHIVTVAEKNAAKCYARKAAGTQHGSGEGIHARHVTPDYSVYATGGQPLTIVRQNVTGPGAVGVLLGAEGQPQAHPEDGPFFGGT